MENSKKTTCINKLSAIAPLGATIFAFFGSCCALPLLLMGLGVGSAGLSSTLAPVRPYLIGVTLLLLGVAFYAVYRRPVCAEDGVCNLKGMRRTKILLWTATGIVLLLLIGPDLIARCLLS